MKRIDSITAKDLLLSVKDKKGVVHLDREEAAKLNVNSQPVHWAYLFQGKVLVAKGLDGNYYAD
jgi:hypothetical protein